MPSLSPSPKTSRVCLEETPTENEEKTSKPKQKKRNKTSGLKRRSRKKTGRMRVEPMTRGTRIESMISLSHLKIMKRYGWAFFATVNHFFFERFQFSIFVNSLLFQRWTSTLANIFNWNYPLIDRTDLSAASLAHLSSLRVVYLFSAQT